MLKCIHHPCITRVQPMEVTLVTSSRRSRVERYPDLPSFSNTYDGPNLIAQNISQSSTGYSQVTVSHGNKISNLYSKERKYLLRNREDIGGSFSTISVDCRGVGERVKISNGPKTAGVWFEFDGILYAWHRNLPFTIDQAPQPSFKFQMDALGTQAIARILPTNPLSGMGQFLGELRDLPRLPEIQRWRDRAHEFRHKTKHVDFDKLSRDAASEYLNGVFGWAPFVGDLQKFFSVARDSARHMSNYARGANRVLRRKYHFPEVSSTTIGGGSLYYGDPALPTWCVAKDGRIDNIVQTSTKRWLSAAFTYYLPPIIPGDNEFVTALNKAKQTEAYANRLFGLRLTPDLVWKLTPWSWAADWVTTAGDVIHNWSAFANDGLVMKYAYMMEHKTNIETWHLRDLVTVDGRHHDLTQSRRASMKQRTIGTPYGFGLNTAAFTAKQWAVIAALGISKQPLSVNIG